MSKPDGFYDLPLMRRTKQELKELAQKKTGENYSCCHEPALRRAGLLQKKKKRSIEKSVHIKQLVSLIN